MSYPSYKILVQEIINELENLIKEDDFYEQPDVYILFDDQEDDSNEQPDVYILFDDEDAP